MPEQFCIPTFSNIPQDINQHCTFNSGVLLLQWVKNQERINTVTGHECSEVIIHEGPVTQTSLTFDEEMGAVCFFLYPRRALSI
jgi:hypothetical protein